MNAQDGEIVIGFDLDGVIIDHTQNKIRIAARYGITLRPKDTPTEYLRRLVPPEIHAEIRERLYDDTDEALSAPLMEGAFGGLARLKELEIPYFLISRRKKPLHALHLIERRDLWGTYFTPENTFFVEEMKDKEPVARELGVTHFIDDEFMVLDVMPSVKHRVLFDSRDIFSEEIKFLRVKSWKELEQLLGIASK